MWGPERWREGVVEMEGRREGGGGAVRDGGVEDAPGQDTDDPSGRPGSVAKIPLWCCHCWPATCLPGLCLAVMVAAKAAACFAHPSGTAWLSPRSRKLQTQQCQVRRPRLEGQVALGGGRECRGRAGPGGDLAGRDTGARGFLGFPPWGVRLPPRGVPAPSWRPSWHPPGLP